MIPSSIQRKTASIRAMIPNALRLTVSAEDLRSFAGALRMRSITVQIIVLTTLFSFYNTCT